jgi:hypothetical protein
MQPTHLVRARLALLVARRFLSLSALLVVDLASSSSTCVRVLMCGVSACVCVASGVATCVDELRVDPAVDPRACA